MKLLPGDEIEYTVSYLAMNKIPEFGFREKSLRNTLLLRTKNPPATYFLELYRRVGADYEWTDMLLCPLNEVERFLSNTRVEMYTFLKDGWTAGFFVLDRREKNVCDLAYFGLVFEAIGFGFGKYLLRQAIELSWEFEETRRVTVNTNSLDHPNALPLYKKMGFKLLKSKVQKRILERSRNAKSTNSLTGTSNV